VNAVQHSLVVYLEAVLGHTATPDRRYGLALVRAEHVGVRLASQPPDAT
jgi:hypothetical protein